MEDPVQDSPEAARAFAPPSARSGREEKLAVVFALALALGAILARVFVLIATRSTTEDFYITLRYAENLARGQGFVYNPGERVLGTTTPLYTLLLALASRLGLDATAIGKGLNILADGAACFLLARLLGALGRPLTGLLAALLYATASAPVNFSIGGMETGLVTLASLSAIYGYVTHRIRLLALALALLFLLRIDGLLLAGVLGGALSVRLLGVRKESKFPTSNNAQRLLTLLLVVVLVVPWLVFATWYFGSPLPTSMTAKIIVYRRMRPEFLPNWGDFRHQFFGGAAQRVLFVLFLTGLFHAWRAHRPLRAPLVWLFAYYATMLLSRVPTFGWYFVPPLPLYYGVATLGLRYWALGVRGLASLLTPNAQRLLLGALAALLFARLPSVATDIAAAQRLEDEVRRPLGLWLAQNTAPHERIMLEPIGYIGYFSKRPVLDIIGLVSPEVLPYYRRDVRFPLGEIITRFRPHVLVLRREERDALHAYERATGRRLLDGKYRFLLAYPGQNRPVFYLYRRVGG